ncbi:MAG TPA: CoA pyrophosphatase [Acidimicrobiales bacterium]|nr:CoA pyrophosphatase [Acidimicrobiales bacterium]
MPPPTIDPDTPRQVIPRPQQSRAGRPARWAELHESGRRSIRLERVRAAVTAGGGWVAQSPDPRRQMAAFAGMPPGPAAAVLVPLYEEEGETRVVLTVRSSDLSSHRDEVAFPGGRLDAGEKAIDGALREAWEEVGLDPGAVSVIGTLHDLATASSNTIVTPVVGTLEGRPSLTANPGEVARIFDLALADLLIDGVFHEEWWSVPSSRQLGGLPEGEFPVWFFEAGGEMIWGATARILVDLLSLVLGTGEPRGD